MGGPWLEWTRLAAALALDRFVSGVESRAHAGLGQLADLRGGTGDAIADGTPTSGAGRPGRSSSLAADADAERGVGVAGGAAGGRGRSARIGGRKHAHVDQLADRDADRRQARPTQGGGPATGRVRQRRSACPSQGADPQVVRGRRRTPAGCRRVPARERGDVAPAGAGDAFIGASVRCTAACAGRPVGLVLAGRCGVPAIRAPSCRGRRHTAELGGLPGLRRAMRAGRAAVRTSAHDAFYQPSRPARRYNARSPRPTAWPPPCTPRLPGLPCCTGQGPRRVRPARRTPADGRDRSPVRLRRGAARPDPGQGRDALPDQQLLVRARPRTSMPQPPHRHRRRARCCPPASTPRCTPGARW